MNTITSHILYRTYRQIRQKTPTESWKSVKLLVPLIFLSNIIELVGVFLLFPVITLLLSPDLINENKWFNLFFEAIGIIESSHAIIFSFGVILIFFILKNVILYLVISRQSKIQFKIATEIVLNNFEEYLDKDHDFLESHNTAVLLRNIRQIPYEFVAFVLIPFINIIVEIAVLTLASIIIFIFNPLLFSSILVFAIPILFLYSKYYKKKLANISANKDKYGADQYRSALQALDVHTEIKIFQKKSFFIPKFRQSTESFESTLSTGAIINTFSPKITETVAVASLFVLILVGFTIGLSHESLSNFLLLFAIGSFKIIPSLNKITLSLNYIKGNNHVFDHLIDPKTKNEETEKVVSNKFNFNEEILIKDLSFSYNDTDDLVLKQINLNIPKGYKIGLIGESGAGKSTFLSILLRFYKEVEGEIQIDRTQINNSNRLKWYNSISYVPQNVTLIDGSVANNIAFGVQESEIDYELIDKIIHNLNLDSFVNSLPNGSKTSLGANNSNISGGQKQRIGIARAIYHGGEILILDEATSALDSKNEELIMDLISNLEDQTVIFVTHRISALANFDKIYEFNQGILKLKDA